MGGMIYVEILDRRGQVESRTRIERFPASVGRGYGNDVIVDDRFVSPRHLEIVEEGDDELVIKDAGSANGTRRVGEDEALESAPLRPGLLLRIGETSLRFATADMAVAPAERMFKSDGLLDKLKSAPVALGVVLLAFAMLTADTYLEAYYDVTWVDIAGPPVAAMVVFALWAALWSFVNRVLTHRFDFLRHASLACLAVIAMLLAEPVSEYTEFLLSSHTPRYLLELVILGFVLGGLIYGHLATIPVSSLRGRKVWATGFAILVLALASLLDYSQRVDFSPGVSITTPLKGLGSSWVSTVTPEVFFEQAQSTKEWVDSQNEK